MLDAEFRHRIMEVMYRRGIDHADSHPTDLTLPSRPHPPAEVTRLGNHSLREGNDFGGLTAKPLPTTVPFEEWKTESPFEFGQSLRERRRRHPERSSSFGEGLVIGNGGQIRQLLNGEIEQRPLCEGSTVSARHLGTLLLSLSVVKL